jgi:hypothetical protein
VGECQYGCVYFATQDAFRWTSEWLNSAAEEFQEITGHALPRGVILAIEHNQRPPWLLHRYMRIASKSADPQFYFGGNGDDPIDIASAVQIPAACAEDIGIRLRPDDVRWVCVLLTDSAVKCRLKEALAAMRKEAGYQSGGAMVLVAGAALLIGEDLVDYGVELSELLRREIAFDAAVGALPVSREEQQLLRERVRIHFGKQLAWLRARRPQVRD